MDILLVKIFATALTLSQVTTAPDALKTHFDRDADQGKVVALLRDGCMHMRKVFEIEDINLDDLLATAMQDPDSTAGGSTAGGSAAFRGIKFADLQNAYRQFCTDEPVAQWGFDAPAVIDFYNKTLADLPDPARLKGLKLPGATVVLDGKGARFKEVSGADQRRISVPLSDIPVLVQKAFVAAEDKRFYEHAGIDERGLIRAAVADMAEPGHPQGGSTITQQVVKNLLVGDDVSYERKIREIVLSSRLEHVLSKDEILELYLNTIYLGRSSWGVEMAARSYFGKSAKDLTLAEGALLAGLPKGPSYFSPDRYPDRMRERRAYVLGRMQEDGVITAAEAAAGARERAGPHSVREAATRLRLRFRRSGHARSHQDRGHQWSDVEILHHPLDHRRAAAAERGGSPAGGSVALRAGFRPRAFPRPGDQSERRHRAPGEPGRGTGPQGRGCEARRQTPRLAARLGECAAAAL